ncbi:hypothetical protein B296_00050925 [Ensete ventricosum]|uniref:Uncharacterized protein n=1 Tax=Ensete ventricosum TaxID=4639 RepID=A0A426Y394_ENSVE|nr:hypothetical protein B296_00050925 [Ensete ventricosum]
MVASKGSSSITAAKRQCRCNIATAMRQCRCSGEEVVPQLYTREEYRAIPNVPILYRTVCGLHSRLINSLVPHDYWSTLDSSEKGVYLEAFEFLGSKKAKSAFLLSTTIRSNFSGTSDEADEDNGEDVRSLLVVPLIKKMGRIAMHMEDVQMRIAFNSFKMISLQTGSEGSRAYAIHMLVPLYKVCEAFAGKVYNRVRKNLKKKRDKRRQEQKLLAVINPMRHAKMKLRIAAKHRAHKKRKIMSMKMGRGRR